MINVYQECCLACSYPDSLFDLSLKGAIKASELFMDVSNRTTGHRQQLPTNTSYKLKTAIEPTLENSYGSHHMTRFYDQITCDAIMSILNIVLFMG